MSTTFTLTVGRNYTLRVMDSGGPDVQCVGTIDVMALSVSRYEADVIVLPDHGNIEEARCLLSRVDLDLDELREGPVYVLRNCNIEWLS